MIAIKKTRGRPAAQISIPSNKFSVDSLYKQIQENKDVTKRYSRPCISAFVREAAKSGKIKLISKKILHTSGRGQPTKFYIKVK